ASASARSENPGDQCRRSDETAATNRTPARIERHGLRLALHERQAHHLWLPWIPLAGPPANISPDQPQPPRPRLFFFFQAEDGIRDKGAERLGPIPLSARRG